MKPANRAKPKISTGRARELKLLRVLALGAVLAGATACSTVQGVVAEERANMALRTRVSTIVYLLPRADLKRAVEQDAKRSEDWHREHTPFYGEGKLLAHGWWWDELEFTGVPPGPEELKAASEIFVISPVEGHPDRSRVWILNSADRARKYVRELAFYKTVDLQGAAEIETAVRRENPEINLDPWSARPRMK